MYSQALINFVNKLQHWLASTCCFWVCTNQAMRKVYCCHCHQFYRKTDNWNMYHGKHFWFQKVSSPVAEPANWHDYLLYKKKSLKSGRERRIFNRVQLCIKLAIQDAAKQPPHGGNVRVLSGEWYLQAGRLCCFIPWHELLTDVPNTTPDTQSWKLHNFIITENSGCQDQASIDEHRGWRRDVLRTIHL